MGGRSFGSGVYRHELKYLISYREKDIIERRLREFAAMDSHAPDGGYFVRSLYFDDYWNSAYNEKMGGTLERDKYRIRIYNGSDSVISLERKHKRGSYILKEGAFLSRSETDSILSGDYGFLLSKSELVCRSFYVECMGSVMRPKVIVDYDRIPYVFEPGTVRITFDMRVRSGFMSYDIFDLSIPTYETMDPDMLILEVKYTEFLPQIFRDVIPSGAQIFTAASKFTMACDVRRDVLGI